MNETRDLYFKIKYDTTYYGVEKVTYQYLDMREDVKYFYAIQDVEFKNQIQAVIDKTTQGLFYKGFYICFIYKNEKYYISHHHETKEFIYEITEILKYHNATDILIKYGELD